MPFEIATVYAKAGRPGFPNNNYHAPLSPGATDDNTKGYSIGSRWFNIKTGQVYVAASVGTGTAAWTAKGVLHPIEGAHINNIYRRMLELT